MFLKAAEPLASTSRLRRVNHFSHIEVLLACFSHLHIIIERLSGLTCPLVLTFALGKGNGLIKTGLVGVKSAGDF